MRDLEELFRRYPGRPLMREAARAYRRCWARARSAGPLTGSYYWVPLPGRDGCIHWTLQEFFDHWQPSSDHSYVWKHIRDSLELHWQRSMKGIGYCSLPRGRVSARLNDGGFSVMTEPVIYHGHDSPLGDQGLETIRQAFHLAAGVKAIFDEHEQMIAGQPESLTRALRLDLGLKGVELSELDWDG